MIKLIAVGRLTKDIEVQVIPNEKKTEVANFSLACRDNKDTEFINCTAWGDVASVLSKNTKKGSLLYVEGSYKTKEYIDEKTQIKHKRIFINLEKFEFLSKKEKEEDLLSDI